MNRFVYIHLFAAYEGGYHLVYEPLYIIIDLCAIQKVVVYPGGIEVEYNALTHAFNG
jgi:hypothetical protein